MKTPMASMFPDRNLGLEVAVGGPQRGRSLTEADLESVVAVYRRAWENGEPVTKAVQEACYLSRDGAAKRIKRARAAGPLDGVGAKR